MPTVQAQTESCTRRTIAVSVLDKNGEPVPGLTAADFRAEFRGNPVQILAAGMRKHPMRIVVLLDRSGSMRGAGDWHMGVKAVGDLFAKAPPESLLGLLFFNETVTDRFDFSVRRSSVQDALVMAARDTKMAKGRSAFLDAIITALSMFSPAQPGDVIYAVTDGGDNASRAGNREVEERLLTSGVRFFAFPVFLPISSRPREPDELGGPFRLSALAEITGGGSFPWDLRSDQRGAFAEKFYRRMTEFYELEIELPQKVDKARGWKLELIRAKELQRPVLTYPQRLMTCSSPAAQP